ncbi:hypothetical protein IWQ56_001453 [Coemansia nantahalensis]|nr:hypothetical protein IWQ56_001453 [Coemansia nantahalensis]
MSEEGEANEDVGRLPEASRPPPAGAPGASGAGERRQSEVHADREHGREGYTAPPHTAATEAEDSAHGHPEARPGGDWGYAAYDVRHDAEEHGYPREPRPHSRGSSRGRGHPRHDPEYDPGFPDSRAARRRDPRDGEGDYRGGAYRQGRYGEREGPRGGYYRRYEWEHSRYKRREPGRGAYPRAGYGGGGGSEGGDEEYLARRDMDKERAIEELRLRVRGASDRPPEEGRPDARDHIRSASRHQSAAQWHVGGDGAGAAVEDPALRPEAPPPVDMDDLEEGEHVEGAMDVDPPQEIRYAQDRDEPARRRSRSRGAPQDLAGGRAHATYERSGSRSRSPGRSRAYAGQPHYEPEDRRAGNYRRQYEDRAERHEYRSRDPSVGRPGRYYSRLGEASYPARYADRRSPDAREGPYRDGQRDNAGRSERDGEDALHRRQFEGDRSPPRYWQRSRSPPPTNDGGLRGRGGREGRYYPEAQSMTRDARSRSRSPRGYPRGDDDARDPPYGTPRGYRQPRDAEPRWHGSARRGYGSRPSPSPPPPPPRYGPGHPGPAEEPRSRMQSPPPPPPPPPMTNSQSAHTQPYADSSPHRDYQRSQRRLSRSRARDLSTPQTPHRARHEYDGHSRDPSGGRRHGSRSPSPSAPCGPGLAPIPDIAIPALSVGTDLLISRCADAAGWLAVREQVREQQKRVQELAARARRTGFELAYANWGGLKADSQVQIAMWQLERAEQGLASAGSRSLLDAALAEL